MCALEVFGKWLCIVLIYAVDFCPSLETWVILFSGNKWNAKDAVITGVIKSKTLKWDKFPKTMNNNSPCLDNLTVILLFVDDIILHYITETQMKYCLDHHINLIKCRFADLQEEQCDGSVETSCTVKLLRGTVHTAFSTRKNYLPGLSNLAGYSVPPQHSSQPKITYLVSRQFIRIFLK